MAIIGFSQDMVVEYIPEYRNNRNNNTPCVVGLKYVPYAKAMEYAKRRSWRSAHVKDYEARRQIAQEVQKEQFLDNVVSVTGVFDGPRNITDVTEFYGLAPYGLVIEIMTAMKDALILRAGLLKSPA